MVEGVDRPVALTGPYHPLAPDHDLDRGLRHDQCIGSMLRRDPERLQFEKVMRPSGSLPQHQLERSVSGLEVVAPVLHVLDLVEHLGGLVACQRDAQIPSLGEYGRTARQLRDHGAGSVAYLTRVLVLVSVGTPGQGRGVQARLVGERRRAHVRTVRVEADVHDLRDVVGDGRQYLEPVRIEHWDSHFQHQVREDGGEVGVAGPLPVAVDASLHLADPHLDRCQRRRHRATGVVVEVHS